MDLGRTAGDPVEMAVDTAARGGAGTFGRGKTEKAVERVGDGL